MLYCYNFQENYRRIYIFQKLYRNIIIKLYGKTCDYYNINIIARFYWITYH